MDQADHVPTQPRITHRTHSRIGLAGNPSDQYHGKVLAFSLANFWAEVTLQPLASNTIRFVPHPVHDKHEYGTLTELVRRVSTEGYYGSERLLMAACKAFADYCAAHGWTPETAQRGFALSYDTTVPRQLGLAGSSAIVYSALRCLMQFHGCDIPPAHRPAVILAAEQELGITAGLQDRVVQVYGGLVYMDFDEQYMAAHGGAGRYTHVGCEVLPPLHLMYSNQPKESGKVHSTVRSRWLAGEPEAKAIMDEVVECGVQGLKALRGRDHAALAAVLDRNFDARRRLFGDGVLGSGNIRMMELARSVGASVNFTGSGGALVVYCPEGDGQAQRLQQLATAEGFSLVPVQVAPELETLPRAEPCGS